MGLNEHGVPVFKEHSKFTVTGDTSSVRKQQEKGGEKGFSCQTKELNLTLPGRAANRSFQAQDNIIRFVFWNNLIGSQ